jgi:hypothetical protein
VISNVRHTILSSYLAFQFFHEIDVVDVTGALGWAVFAHS